jgi:integrase
MKNTGNTILITGGSSGFGREYARAWHDAGNTVIVAARSADELEETAKGRENLHAMPLDVADAAAVEQFAKEIVERFPDLNIVMNNAGIMPYEDITGARDLSDAEKVIAINVLGPIRLTDALIDHLKAQDDAVLINVALDTLFRASNILAIEVNHIDWQAKTVFAPRSKTDQSGEGHYGYLSDETAELLTRWLDTAKITDGYIFRKLSPKQTVQKEPMQYQALLKRYEAIGMAINTDGKFTCHSTRTGGVLTLMEADVPMAEIVLSGNWKSEAMAIRYAKQYQAGKTGMAKVR